MKYFELDKDEKQQLKDFEQGKLKRISNLDKEKKKLFSYVKNTLDKTRNINIRVSEADLLKVKAKASQKGIPYQTMITSLIHQYSTGQIKE